MLTIYNLFIFFFRIGIGIAAWRSEKAAAWINGRRGLLAELTVALAGNPNIIWVHAASAGELEQGKPVIEALKEKYPRYQVLVTFFSPSGFSASKKYRAADHVFYLPLDTRRNAEAFLALVKPKLVIFIKYDFWYHHLKAVHDRGIPLLLISSIFREKQLFFSRFGGFYRNILKLFTWLFVQDEHSMSLLNSIDVQNCSIAGDTRFDRVSGIQEKREGVESILPFVAGAKVVMAGSTWPEDEELLSDLAKGLPKGYKLIIAPHEITPAHIRQLQSLFPDALLHSALAPGASRSVLIIDNVGMLSRLYQYAELTYIGGGFNKSGIHNTLEAAVWGKPVIVGPNYLKFKEARELIEAGGAFTISGAEQLIKTA
ncbi:MAG TPA: glycosyltransferase N-terminal domain-containing protein, partial [Flavisolibacter sp.]|nr:glycosyltransferase N-terminal domain-containing protein [Flavisolibacter sp.]